MSDSYTNNNRSSLFRSTLIVSAATVLSKITGFIRTWAMAFALGNTALASSYQIAFNLPSMLFELVAGGILTTAFLPVYLSVKSKQGDKAAWGFVSNLFNLALVALGLVVLLATFFAPQVIATQTFLTGGDVADQAIFFFRFFAVQILFLGLSALLSGVLNAHRRYFFPNAAAVFNNIIVIITFFGYVPLSAQVPGFAMIWLAIGTTLGCFSMLVCQIPTLLKLGFSYVPKINLHDPALREVARIAIPVIIFTVANLVAVSFRNAFALDVADNGPSTIQYAWMWYQLPYGIAAAALSITLFTELSDYAANNDQGRFKDLFLSGLRLTVFIIMPFAVCLMVLADPLISLYRAGEFTTESIGSVSQVLFWWGTTLPLYAIYMYLYRVFSALKDLVAVAKVDVILRVFNIGCYAVLTVGIGPFEGLGLIGIPIADTIFYCVMNVVLVLMLQRRIGRFFDMKQAVYILKLVAVSLASALIGAVIIAWIVPEYSGIFQALCVVVLCGLVIFSSFFVFSRFLKVPEMNHLGRLFRKLKKPEKGAGDE